MFIFLVIGGLASAFKTGLVDDGASYEFKRCRSDVW